jgi:hypothetical protein
MSRRGGKAAVALAHERQNGHDGVVTLSTGVRARIRPVAATLLEEVSARIPEPEVPIWHNPDKDRDEPNPSHPQYIAAQARANRERGLAAIDAMVMFGVELVDGLPENDGWLEKLKFLEKKKLLSLADYNLEDPVDKEFLYKRFIAVASTDLRTISQRSGITPEEIARAAGTFPGDEARASDTGSTTEPSGGPGD